MNMMNPIRVTVPVLLSMIFLQAGCENEYPEQLTGGVTGHVTYEGTALQNVESPVLVVSAYAYQPDILERLRNREQVISHASYMVVQPAFANGPIFFELEGLERFEKGYLVTAVILDMANSEAGAYVSGVYPDNSLMFTPPSEGPVMIIPDETITGINFDMMDIPR